MISTKTATIPLPGHSVTSAREKTLILPNRRAKPGAVDSPLSRENKLVYDSMADPQNQNLNKTVNLEYRHMLTHTQEQFFALLRAGLWDKPIDTEELGTDVDWKEIYKIAREQTVIGLIADAINTLPAAQRPPMPILQRFIMEKLAIERSHVKLNAVLNEVVQALNAHNIPHILLKGQGVAQNYAHPTSRTCGDIDLYVGEKNYTKANIIIKAISDHPEKKAEESIKHASFKVNGVEIEVHRMASILDSRKSDRCFQKFTREMLDAGMQAPIEKTLLKQWNNDGILINLPPQDYNAVFLLIHMMRHLIEGGIGFRQACDWVRFLHRHQLDPEQIAQILTDTGLKKVWNSFAGLSYKYLGLPKARLPVGTKVNERAADRIVAIIFATGNFGHHDVDNIKAHDQRHFIHKLKRFIYHIKYYNKSLMIFPKLSILATSQWIIRNIKKMGS